MNLIHSLILGLVEGLTEFLPVSSTGHLILTAKILALPQSEFLKSFEIIIQLGAILAVVALYGRSLLLNAEILKRILAAFLPSAVLGLFFYKFIKKFLLSSQIVLWALFAGGVLLILFEIFHREKETATDEISKMSYRQSFLIGVFQSFAFVPGVSRSAATILGGMGVGLKRKTVVEFSFVLAVPTMLAATGLDLLKSGRPFSGDEILLLATGLAASFAVAVFGMRFFLNFIKNNNFIGFGVWRIAVAVLFWCLR
ncbi:MAG: undecaprenyl-diphosphate phosphatase [Candidatus Omnitrophica bacterium]|nr:undecaprenyl-diphosphate phosphatase [Candidatus Omnitrophota bacterium]